MGITVDFDRLKAQISLPDSEDKSSDDALTRVICLAWVCGTHEEHHRLLRSEYEHLIRMGAVPPELRKGEMRALFNIVLHSSVPELRFPDRWTVPRRVAPVPTLALRLRG